jgi:hypothetical protein
MENPQFLAEIVCAQCAHTGAVTWEGPETARRFVSTTGFKRVAGAEITLACDNCGTSHLIPDASGQ